MLKGMDCVWQVENATNGKKKCSTRDGINENLVKIV